MVYRLLFLCVLIAGCNPRFEGANLIGQLPEESSGQPGSTDPIEDSPSPPSPMPPTPPVGELPPPLPSDDHMANSPCSLPEIFESLPVGPGSKVLNESLLKANGMQRDRLVMSEFLSGQGLDRRSGVSPIRIRAGQNELVVCVTDDYLFLSDEGENYRFPLGMTVLSDLVRRTDWSLPTTRLVDLIYQQAIHKLPPRTMSADSQMTSTLRILEHSEIINDQLATSISGLRAGHKKDVVISQRLASRPDRIAIYGWHRSETSVIQPLSTVHHKDYGDYSQGVRLIYKWAWLNGDRRSLKELLGSSATASLLSSEGVLDRQLLNRYY